MHSISVFLNIAISGEKMLMSAKLKGYRVKRVSRNALAKVVLESKIIKYPKNQNPSQN